MIDLHTHILPGVDDGSGSMEESLTMAEMASYAGTEILVATPHSNQIGRFENYYNRGLADRFKHLEESVKAEDIPLIMVRGMEIFATDDMRERIQRGELISLNASDYYLVEFPFGAAPEWIQARLMDIISLGKIPLIAHPERYYCAQDQPEYIYHWLTMGCLTQMNKGSMFGRFGKHAQELADLMLRYRLVTVISSDAHSPIQRTPHMGEAWDYVADKIGMNWAFRLFERNGERILRNERVPRHWHRPGRQKRLY